MSQDPRKQVWELTPEQVKAKAWQEAMGEGYYTAWGTRLAFIVIVYYVFDVLGLNPWTAVMLLVWALIMDIGAWKIYRYFRIKNTYLMMQKWNDLTHE